MKRFDFFRLTSLTFILTFLCVPSLFAQWEPAIKLTYVNYIAYPSPKNARWVAAKGDTVHIVWFDNRDGKYGIFYKRSTDSGKTWEKDRCLQGSANPHGSTFPGGSMAVSGAKVHLAWVEDKPSIHEDVVQEIPRIHYMVSTDGGNHWKSNRQVEIYWTFPCLAASGETVHLVWWGGYYMRSTDAGANWEPENCLISDHNADLIPSVAVSGWNVHIVWACEGNIFYIRSTDGGGKWLPKDTLFLKGLGCSGGWYSSIAVSDSSVYVASWETKRERYSGEIEREGYSRIYCRISTNGGATWGPNTPLALDSSYATNPTIAASGSKVHLSWTDTRNGKEGIFYKRSTDKGKVWEPDTCLTDDASHSDFSSIAVSGTKVHVVWYEYRDGKWGIYYMRNPTGNK